MIAKVLVTFIVAFLITLAATPLFISYMKKKQFGQQIRDDGPARHTTKAGTPTMGGVVFLGAAALAVLITAGRSPITYIMLMLMLSCGLIGFMDDYLKMALNRSLGLKARSKMIGELLIALIFIALLYMTGYYAPEVKVPFSSMVIPLGLLYIPLILVLVSASTNAVNLTDGVDGLATGVSIIALLAFTYYAFKAEEPAAAIFCVALIGALTGFLIYNRNPAKIFMGDAGSLGLGGAFAALAVITGAELLLIIVGGIFVIEALSVIAQVISFQLTGKRILRMAPLHHHFELKGWSEWRVVLTFWGAGAVFALLGILAYQ